MKVKKVMSTSRLGSNINPHPKLDLFLIKNEGIKTKLTKNEPEKNEKTNRFKALKISKTKLFLNSLHKTKTQWNFEQNNLPSIIATRNNNSSSSKFNFTKTHFLLDSKSNDKTNKSNNSRKNSPIGNKVVLPYQSSSKNFSIGEIKGGNSKEKNSFSTTKTQFLNQIAIKKYIGQVNNIIKLDGNKKTKNIFFPKSTNNVAGDISNNNLNNFNNYNNYNNTITIKNTSQITKNYSYAPRVSSKKLFIDTVNNQAPKIICVSDAKEFFRPTCFVKSVTGKNYMNIPPKKNQDSYLFLPNIFSFPNFSAFGVFDGHGDNGHFVSGLIKKYFTDLFQDKNFYISKTTENSEEIGLSEKTIHKKFKNSNLMKTLLNKLDKKIKNQLYDTSLSGSTCVLGIQIESQLLFFNTGDSRAIYISKNNIVFPITIDHKPDLPEESKRIISCGGKIQRIPGTFDGPFRVWVQGQDYPGLAMSRSLGDFAAKQVGVICTPDCYELDIQENQVKAVVFGSDGLFEYLTNEEIKNIVLKYDSNKKASDACKELVKTAINLWNDNWETRDDITAIVIYY